MGAKDFNDGGCERFDRNYFYASIYISLNIRNVYLYL